MGEEEPLTQSHATGCEGAFYFCHDAVRELFISVMIRAYRSMNCPMVKHLRNEIDRCGEEKKRTFKPAEVIIDGGVE